MPYAERRAPHRVLSRSLLVRIMLGAGWVASVKFMALRPCLFLEKHSDRLPDPGIIPEMEPSHVLPRRVLDCKAGGMLDHAPRPRKAAGHFLGPPAALDEPNYHLRSFRTGHHPADLCWRYPLHHFGAEFVSLAEGYTGRKILSHSVRVRLEHRRCFHDDDADRLAGVAKNEQEVRHDLTV
jgi:hypothetical protein